jgi:glycosyltransferase involved in cell wall biosynthesis
MKNLGVSVIVTTYNWPNALNRVLSGLCSQHYSSFEIIVADDGSTPATKDVITAWQAKSDIPIVHCWQPDEGFRAAMIRNRAVAKAKYDYLIFLDGDCVPRPHFVQKHAALAEAGWLVKGNRILLNQTFTAKILQENIPIERWGLSHWFKARMQRNINRFLPLLSTDSQLGRKCFPKKWQGAKTCNLGVWRKDFICVNGLDESYVGWGFEDSDLVIRLQRAEIFCKSGKYAVGVLHLWHPEQDRTKEQANYNRLQQTLAETHLRASVGVEQYTE